jgi:hypothetical protein
VIVRVISVLSRQSDSFGFMKMRVCRDDGGAVSAEEADLEREFGAQHDAICSPSSYASQESANALVDHLLSTDGGEGPRVKSLPLELFSHLLLCLAEKGDSFHLLFKHWEHSSLCCSAMSGFSDGG